MLDGRITKGVGGLYSVATDDGIKFCKPRGILRKNNLSPIIGDTCSVTEATGGRACIESLGPRRNELVRPRVSNIDAAVAVCSADNLNLFQLDKYLAILGCQAAGNKFEICVLVNKTDLAEPGALHTIGRVYESAGLRTLFVSAITGSGIDRLKTYLNGKTAVLAGQSGAGKSSVVNALCGSLKMAVGELSAKINRGKHTTRHAEMFACADNDGFVIDTPGFASLTFAGMSRDGLRGCFPEFTRFANGCRFADCRHMDEPGCAVREEAGNGVSASRYENYARFYKELSLSEPY